MENMKNVGQYFQRLNGSAIASMIDYIGGTAQYPIKHITAIRERIVRDNGSFYSFGAYTVLVQGEFPYDSYTIVVSYHGHSVPVASLRSTMIGPEYIFKWDIYGKGLVVLRSGTDLFLEFLEILQNHFGLTVLNLTRYDHCIDIIKQAKRKQLKPHIYKKLKTISPIINPQTGKTTYIRYGSRNAAQFYRVYDKSLDLQDNGFARLYPEYNNKNIERYELQVTSKGIPKQSKEIYTTQLLEIANHCLLLHPQATARRNDQCYEGIRDRIRHIRREGDIEQLVGLRDRLQSHLLQIQKQIDNYYLIHSK